MKVDLLYTAHNRLAFTEETFAALLANTNWERVERLHVLDDASTDGTWDYLSGVDGAVWSAPERVAAHAITEKFGGPVAAMNYALDRCESGVLAKVDSDCVVCPGWLDALLDVLAGSLELDVLGMEPGFASFVQPPEVAHRYKAAPFIGGLGLIRTRVFARARPVMNNRFFGWTEHQRRHAKAGWIDPDLPVFLLDHLDFEPWRSLTQAYIENGWQREVVGAPYTAEQVEAYAGWWLRDRVSVA